jgi:hypothetical protein
MPFGENDRTEDEQRKTEKGRAKGERSESI